MEKQPNSRMGLVCGIENAIGLKLKLYTDDEERCIARFRPKPEHQGCPGHLHGGIISTLLDEPNSNPCTLWRSCCMTEYYCILEKREVDSVEMRALSQRRMPNRE